MTRYRLCGLTADEIHGLLQSKGADYANAVKISNSIYKKGIASVSQIQGVSGSLRRHLESVAESGIYAPASSEESADGTIKYLYISPDGLKYESVWMPGIKRRTVCLSVQSGCRMGCPFCATARYGFHGNLTAGDMINQVLSVPGEERPTHVVFMGMGEPMDNLEEVLKACSILTAEWGAALSPRNITVSTVGITPAVNEFLARSKCNLAVSLLSPFGEERKKAVPAESLYPVHEIISILKSFPAVRKRRFSVAYVMIRNVNDSIKHLDGLKSLLADTGIRVNLLPYHKVKGDSHESSTEKRMMQFKHELVTHGISASVRRSRGADISAACGLLASALKD